MIKKIEIDEVAFLVSCSDDGSVELPILCRSAQTGSEYSKELTLYLWRIYKKLGFKSRF